ncbi:protein-histidine pros-kinase [Formivibrio citricus]|uniref:histidine kinase n=1 Tax=Formivibrio citricus TaxID=83765 RepID=A0A1I4YW69_9NEIS|nr:nitrogen fixation negative regulator NifL [Formivibrio citricus]SFN42264.1 protein-histidine pros-kinase [Formivibrio citricus]
MVIADNPYMDKITLPPSAAPTGLPDTLFQELVEAAPVAVTITDAKGGILYVNPAFCAITGYGIEEVIGANPSLLSYKTTPREIYTVLWENIEAGQPWQGRLINKRKDGSRYLAELSITPIRDEQGDIRYFLGIHRDITELHSLNERLQNQKKLTESIIDLAPVAIALLREDGGVVLDNQEYKKLMGSFGKEEPARALLASLQAEQGDAAWAKIQAQGEFADLPLRFDRPGGIGPRWFAVSGSWFDQSESSVDRFFNAEPQRYLLLAITDITAHKRQQQAQWLQTLRTMLAETELISRLRETLSGAAFQLSVPLNLIVAAEKRMAQRLPVTDPTLHALDEARKQGEAALEMLQSAMPAQRTESWMPVNCNELLHDVLNLLAERMLAEGVVVDWKPAMRLPPLLAQPIALRGAIKQLLTNALDALHNNRPAKRELALITRQEGDWIELDIMDSGPGIPEELRLKVFEPFFTTRPGGARAGMGMTLAQEVILRHQGSLEIDSNYLDGCRIVVRLPVELEGIEHD